MAQQWYEYASRRDIDAADKCSVPRSSRRIRRQRRSERPCWLRLRSARRSATDWSRSSAWPSTSILDGKTHEATTQGRRALLAKIGGAALALPFLHEFARRKAPAQDAPAGKMAKNLIVFYSPNGVYHQTFWPIGGERDFKLNVAMESLEKYRTS